MQADVKSLFANFIAQFWCDSQGSLSQDVHDANYSLSAPPIVPGIGTLEMGPAGGETSHTCSLAVHGFSRPSGAVAVQSALEETPPPLC